MALHEQSIGATNEWYTPSYVFDALGCRFDLDAASPGRVITPWIPADEFITARSLETGWRGWRSLSSTATAFAWCLIGLARRGGRDTYRWPNWFYSSARKSVSSASMGRKGNRRRRGPVSIPLDCAAGSRWRTRRGAGLAR